jgi:hypothetical protein
VSVGEARAAAIVFAALMLGWHTGSIAVCVATILLGCVLSSRE